MSDGWQLECSTMTGSPALHARRRLVEHGLADVTRVPEKAKRGSVSNCMDRIGLVAHHERRVGYTVQPLVQYSTVQYSTS
jgi:hypothetical protein